MRLTSRTTEARHTALEGMSLFVMGETSGECDCGTTGSLVCHVCGGVCFTNPHYDAHVNPDDFIHCEPDGVSDPSPHFTTFCGSTARSPTTKPGVQSSSKPSCVPSAHPMPPPTCDPSTVPTACPTVSPTAKPEHYRRLVHPVVFPLVLPLVLPL